MLLSAMIAVGWGGATARAGTLDVRVTDEHALPVPGALLTLLCGGPPIEQPADEDGRTTFTATGTCDLLVSVAGRSLRVPGIAVPADGAVARTVEVELPVVEEVVVSTSRGTILTKEFLNKVPPGRDYQSAVQLAPGVTGGGNPNMAGNASNENTYMLDGANIGSPRRGQPQGETSAHPGQPQGETYAHPGNNPVVMVDQDSLSTFATDVDTASYAMCRRKLQEGSLPPDAAVRVEEFVNAFRYGYAAPEGSEPFTMRLEAAPDPLRDDRVVLSVALQAKEIDREARPVRLTFLVDVSGSMQSPDKLPLVQASLHKLVDGLGAEDRVALVTYAGATRVALPPAWTVDRAPIHRAVDGLSAGGSTAMADGIGLAYGLASDMYVKGAENRVVILTDGDANVGASSPEQLQRLVEGWAGKGITLSVVGFGQGNYKDALLERMADNGDGNYSYIDSLDEADRVFVQGLGGTLVTVARDVKAQLEFPKEAVLAWRQIGYENRAVADEDFRDDRVDGGEIGSAHQVTALYELVLRDRPVGDLVRVHVRAEPPGIEAPAVEYTSTLPVADVRRSFADASRDLRWATAVATFSEVLRHSPHAAETSWRDVLKLVDGARIAGNDDHDELRELVVRASHLSGGLDVAMWPRPVAVPSTSRAAK